MFLAEKLQRFVEDFSMLEDPQDRLAALVNRARKRPPLSPAERVDSHRVRGCVSVVWLVGEVRDGRCYFRSEAESPLVGSLVGAYCDFFSDVPAAEIVASSDDPLASLDLIRNLSPTRRNGLAATLTAIRTFASHAVRGDRPASPASPSA